MSEHDHSSEGPGMKKIIDTSQHGRTTKQEHYCYCVIFSKKKFNKSGIVTDNMPRSSTL